MKQFFSAAVLLFLYMCGQTPCYAGLSATTTWETRAATGNDNNGGGYVPGSTGTDFSQQNAPQFALTGVTSSGAGSVVLTASAATTMVGNIGQAISGTNVVTGFYEVLSVVAGVSITFSANNAGTQICGGVCAAGVINIGGALATLQKTSTAIASGGGNRAWLTGTFTTTAVTTMLNDGTGGATTGGGIFYTGYGVTRGDGIHAVLTTATDSIHLINFGSGGQFSRDVMFRSFTFSSTAGTRGDGWYAIANDSGGMTCDSCLFTGLHNAINGDFTIDQTFPGLTLRNTEITLSTNHALITSSGFIMADCYIHDNTGDGVRFTDANPPTRGSLVVVRTIFYKNANGINTNAQATCITKQCGLNWFFNNIFSDNTATGFTATNGAGNGLESMFLENNVFYSNGTYGLSFVSGVAVYLGASNFYGANGTAARLNASALSNDGTVSADPFVSRTTGNFALNSTAGGGAALKATGFPGVLAAGGTGYIDVGVLQSQGSAGAGVTTTVGIAQ